MSATPSARSKVRPISAVLLLLLAPFLAVAWFVWVGPQLTSLVYDQIVYQGRNSSTWWEAHHRASKALWHHDDFEHMGKHASKDDVSWIIESGDPGEAFNDCGNGHRSTALKYITNQSPGNTREAWQQWWKDNQDKSQNR